MLSFPLFLLIGVSLQQLSVNALTCESKAVEAFQESKLPNCRTRAWVRAPDLAPGSIIQGDVKVKLNGTGCPEVQSYTLGLRYLERGFLKAPRRGVRVAPRNPWDGYQGAGAEHIPDSPGAESDEPSDPNQAILGSRPRIDESKFVRLAEERVVFDISHLLADKSHTPPGHNFVTDFAIVVPNTNYPPTYDHRYFHADHYFALGGAENLYMYYVLAKFTNGKSIEIPAGYTSFDPIVRKAPAEERVTFAMKGATSNDVSTTDIPMIYLELVFPTGRTVMEGGELKYMWIAHGFGGTGNWAPESLTCYAVEQSDPFWAFSHPAAQWDASSKFENRPPKATRLTTMRWVAGAHEQLQNEVRWESALRDQKKRKINMVQVGNNGTWVTEPPIMAYTSVHRPFAINFNSFYEKTNVQLSCTLMVYEKPPPGEGGGNHAEEHHDDHDHHDDEFDWVSNPMHLVSKNSMHRGSGPDRRSTYYTGSVDITVSSDPSDGDLKIDPTHYLHHDAREPVFVSTHEAEALSHMGVGERDDKVTKFHHGAVSQGDDHDIRPMKYAGCMTDPNWGGHYVGETWVKRVVKPHEALNDKVSKEWKTWGRTDL